MEFTDVLFLTSAGQVHKPRCQSVGTFRIGTVSSFRKCLLQFCLGGATFTK